MSNNLPAMSRAGFYRGLMILVVITLAFHGLALIDGKVLDDFWHQKGLREHGWNFSELLRTLKITPADFLHTWWQQKPVVWHYFRPFFILCMKFVFIVLGQGDPVALHVFSLGLHLVSTLLVWRLCRLLTGNETWSLMGGLLFSIYPHSLITVAWPSSQNVVIQTTLLLAMLLTYVRATGLTDILRLGGTSDLGMGSSDASLAPPYEKPYLFLTIGFWLLAILTRENAILAPAILASFEQAYGGWRRLWARRGLYIFFGIVGLGLVVCREMAHVPPLPDVYCRRPGGDWGEYLPWLAAKMVHYVCTSIWVAPMSIGPTGRYNPWREVPGDCLLMLGIIAGIGVVYYRAARAAATWWIWPFWIVLSILPVLALVATPHSGYMGGVGLAVGAALAVSASERTQSRMTHLWAAGLTIVLLLGSAFMTPVNRLQWTGIAAAEKYLPQWVMVSPPAHEVEDVFFINMPFANIYCKPNLVDRLGPWAERLRVHVLNYAPQVLRMDQRSVVEQIDEHSFTTTIEGQAYFSRLVGRFTLGAFRGNRPFRAGERVETKDANVEILDADEHGVWKMKFTFPRALTDSSYCFYMASPECGAARLRFETKAAVAGEARAIGDSVQLETAIGEMEAGHLSAAGPVFATAMATGSPLASRADSALRKMVGYMAGALGARVQSRFDAEAMSASDWLAVRQWWDTRVGQHELDELWSRRHDFDDLIYLRYEVEFDRHVAGVLIHSDLYLTGPPFDDLRDEAGR